MNEIPDYGWSPEKDHDDEDEAPDQVQYSGNPFEAFKKLLETVSWSEQECVLNPPKPVPKDRPGFWWRRRWDIKRARIGDCITASGACLKHGNPWPSRIGGPHLPCVECAMQRRIRVPVVSRKIKSLYQPKNKIVELPATYADVLEVEAAQVAYLMDEGTTEGLFWVWRVVQIVRAA